MTNSYTRPIYRGKPLTFLNFNAILATDVYKLCHQDAVPDDVDGVFSYQEARIKNTVIVPYGQQMLLMKTLANPISMEDIDEAEDYCKRNNAIFHRDIWEWVLNKFGGYFPIEVRTVPEGTPINSGNVMLTIEASEKFPGEWGPYKFGWLAQYIETFMLRGVWYTTTIASYGRKMKQEFKRFYEISGANLDMLVWALNDFGARGVPNKETAEMGGSAHQVNFRGSDTIEGQLAAEQYYFCETASGFAVPASEHFIECSFGLDEEGEEEYLKMMITKFAPRGIVSIVIDGKDMYRATRKLCSPEFVKLIKESGGKVVFRPDSGDMMDTVPWILNEQAKAFGFTLNAKGFKVINNVGVIQGDGIDNVSAVNLMGKIVALGYSADVFVMGSGGGLLQKVNRDSLKFAQKACAIQRKNGVWEGIAKDPITDPGKMSKKGRVSLAQRNGETGPDSYFTYDIDQGLPENCTDVMVTIYDRGVLFNKITFEQIRANAAV